MWFVVCGLWFVVGCLWLLVYCLWFVAGGLWLVVCGRWLPVSGPWLLVCGWWSVVLGGLYAACCVVLLHRVCVWEQVCTATARVLGGAANISLCRSSGVLARRFSDVLAKQWLTHCFARTSLGRPLQRHNEMFAAPPKTLAVAAHTCSQTHDAATPHSMQHSAQPTCNMLQHVCTHPTNQQTLPTHQLPNQPTRQPAKLSTP